MGFHPVACVCGLLSRSPCQKSAFAIQPDTDPVTIRTSPVTIVQLTPASIDLIIRKLSGSELFKSAVPGQTTVFALKQLLEEDLTIPAPFQKLLLGEQELKNRSFIGDYFKCRPHGRSLPHQATMELAIVCMRVVDATNLLAVFDRGEGNDSFPTAAHEEMFPPPRLDVSHMSDAFFKCLLPAIFEQCFPVEETFGGNTRVCNSRDKDLQSGERFVATLLGPARPWNDPKSSRPWYNKTMQILLDPAKVDTRAALFFISYFYGLRPDFNGPWSEGNVDDRVVEACHRVLCDGSSTNIPADDLWVERVTGLLVRASNGPVLTSSRDGVASCELARETLMAWRGLGVPVWREEAW